MFLISAVTQLLFALIFCCLADATRQPWAQDDEKDEDDEDRPMMGQGERDDMAQGDNMGKGEGVNIRQGEKDM